MTIRPPKNITEKIINDLGGAVHVANMVGVSREAIVQWIKNDKIPPENGMRLYCYAAIHYPNQAITIYEIFHYIDDPMLKAGLAKSSRYQEVAA